MQLAFIVTLLLVAACPSLGSTHLGQCPPVCAIFCPYGNVLDENGCPTCRCNSRPTPTKPPLPTVRPTIDCRVVLCARPPCPNPLPPPPGQCCSTCPAPTKPPLPTVGPTVDCSAVLCLRPPCPTPLPPPPGECCATCPAPTKPPLPTVRPTVDCSAVLCLRPPCPTPLPPPPGECCGTCPAPTKPPLPTVRPTIDCRLVRCARPPCPKPLPPLPGQCCPRCLLDCRLVFCPRPLCPNPLPPPPGKCCQRCPDPPLLVCPPLPPGSIGICVEQCSGDDDCPTGQKCCSNGCGHVCKVAVNATVTPVCRRGGSTFKVGQRFPAGDGCNRCICVRPGLIACTEIACRPPTPPTSRPTTAVPSCPGDKVYTTCGSACPATCENLQNPRICIALCVPGCFCPPGKVELGNRCVARGECPSICTLPPKTGPCRAAIPRYFYNSTSERCERFIYGGCLGNDNNFVTQEACVAQCTSPPPTCPPDKPTVNCFADPCQVNTCPAHPEARCESDFCGGCNAKFFDDEDNEVTDSCKCPVEGQLFTSCGSACPPNCTNPTPICTTQCVARCECPRGQVIDERKNKCVPVNQCPATPPTPTCPPDKPPVNCLIDPCRVTSCPAHPEARCESDFCGGCNARFFDDEDNEVTDSCKCPVEGQLFTSCGSACPPNCTNPTPICTTQCVARCECPKGQVIDERKNKCVPANQCPDLCELPAEPGPCKAFFPSYFFNATSGRCERFIYGGCGGNANRFKSRTACRRRCDLCKLRPNTGPCLALIRSYFFNSSSARCERFNYGGCGGNANRFRSVTACQKTCGPPCPIRGQVFQECRTCPTTCNNPNLICTAECRPGCGCPPGMLIDEKKNRCVNRRNCPNVCTLPKDPGPCEALIPSYFFNSTSKRCERFNYGGCGGNGNRFTSLRSCNRKCNPRALCPPVCSATFCKRNRRALCSVPGPREIPGCTGRCQVTFCPACYFSKQPRPLPGRCSLCGAPVSSQRCLKWWANCIHWSDKRRYGLPSMSVRTQENFRCYRYPCPLRG